MKSEDNMLGYCEVAIEGGHYGQEILKYILGWAPPTISGSSELSVETKLI